MSSVVSCMYTDSEGTNNEVDHFTNGGNPDTKVVYNQWKNTPPTALTNPWCHASFSIPPLRGANLDEKAECIKTPDQNEGGTPSKNIKLFGVTIVKIWTKNNTRSTERFTRYSLFLTNFTVVV